MPFSQSLRVFSPAKVNLYLHILNQLKTGHHVLDSVMSFADIGDEIILTPAQGFDFTISGPFSHRFSSQDRDMSPASSNLVVKAVWQMSQLFGKAPNFHVHLTKNLPLGAGIGGGSSNAASIIWGMCNLWDISKDNFKVENLLVSLGADVPVCFRAKNTRIRSTGDVLEPAPAMPDIPIVLVYPGKPCSTFEVFHRFAAERSTHSSYKESLALPQSFDTHDAVFDFLKTTGNDLLKAACYLVPDIENVLQQLSGQDGCRISRLSGSGSCCFGLFETESQAEQAVHTLQQENPDWWVQTGWIGRIERY